jgi:hypothetical protein
MVAAQYETLRTGALGQALPLEARSGLALLLRRGLWGWVLALGQVGAQDRAGGCATPRSTTPGQHNAIVQILAAMAMRATTRRAT